MNISGHRTALISIGGIIALALLGFAYYALSPLFITTRADDAMPGMSQQSTEATGEGDEAMSKAEMPALPASVPVVDTPAHPASGQVRVLTVEGTTYVRYENYQTLNGPDIFVYLAKDLEAKDYVDLGRVRATEGNINYEVPADVDVSEYRYVLTWCKAFGVLFNYADIAPLVP